MTNSGQPIKRTHDMDTKHFALQNWADLDLLTLKMINKADNESNLTTNNIGKTVLYCHMDYLMGRMILTM